MSSKEQEQAVAAGGRPARQTVEESPESRQETGSAAICDRLAKLPPVPKFVAPELRATRMGTRNIGKDQIFQVQSKPKVELREFRHKECGHYLWYFNAPGGQPEAGAHTESDCFTGEAAFFTSSGAEELSSKNIRVTQDHGLLWLDGEPYAHASVLGGAIGWVDIERCEPRASDAERHRDEARAHAIAASSHRERLRLLERMLLDDRKDEQERIRVQQEIARQGNELRWREEQRVYHLNRQREQEKRREAAHFGSGQIENVGKGGAASRSSGHGWAPQIIWKGVAAGSPSREAPLASEPEQQQKEQKIPRTFAQRSKGQQRAVAPQRMISKAAAKGNSSACASHLAGPHGTFGCDGSKGHYSENASGTSSAPSSAAASQPAAGRAAPWSPGTSAASVDSFASASAWSASCEGAGDTSSASSSQMTKEGPAPAAVETDPAVLVVAESQQAGAGAPPAEKKNGPLQTARAGEDDQQREASTSPQHDVLMKEIALEPPRAEADEDPCAVPASSASVVQNESMVDIPPAALGTAVNFSSVTVNDNEDEKSPRNRVIPVGAATPLPKEGDANQEATVPVAVEEPVEAGAAYAYAGKGEEGPFLAGSAGMELAEEQKTVSEIPPPAGVALHSGLRTIEFEVSDNEVERARDVLTPAGAEPHHKTDHADERDSASTGVAVVVFPLALEQNAIQPAGDVAEKHTALRPAVSSGREGDAAGGVPVDSMKAEVVVLSDSDDEVQPIGDRKHWSRIQSRIQISGHDLDTLKPGEWLNDQVIDFYLLVAACELLKPERQHGGQLRWGATGAFVWPTQFWNKLSGEGNKGGGVYNYSAVKRWTTSRGVDLFGLDLLLVPLGDGTHWSLGVVDFRKRELIHFCSLARQKKATKPSWFRYIKKYLADEWKDKKSDAAPPFSFAKGWAREVDANDYNVIDDNHTVGTGSASYAKQHGVPKQNNNIDCGVFAIVFAVQVLRQYVKSRDKRPFALKATPAEIDDWRNFITIEIEKNLTEPDEVEAAPTSSSRKASLPALPTLLEEEGLAREVAAQPAHSKRAMAGGDVEVQDGRRLKQRRTDEGEQGAADRANNSVADPPRQERAAPRRRTLWHEPAPGKWDQLPDTDLESTNPTRTLLRQAAATRERVTEQQIAARLWHWVPPKFRKAWLFRKIRGPELADLLLELDIALEELHTELEAVPRSWLDDVTWMMVELDAARRRHGLRSDCLWKTQIEPQLVEEQERPAQTAGSIRATPRPVRKSERRDHEKPRQGRDVAAHQRRRRPGRRCSRSRRGGPRSRGRSR